MARTRLDTPRVLHVVWNLIRGGTEGQCARVAMQGSDQRVAVFRREGFFLKPVEALCGPVYHFNVKRRRHPATYYELLKLVRFIRQTRIQLIHCWDADAVIFASMAARWAGVPFITSRRDLSEIYPAWKLRAMHKADLKARYLVVNAAAIRGQRIVEGCAPEKIICIPNILDVDEFDSLSSQPFDALPAGRWIGVVARLDPEKDVGTAVRALAKVRACVPDVKLAIAGDGVERSRLGRLAADCDVAEAVYFLGDITAVPSFLRCCEIGLLTPRANEGLSNTILEYMAAGLPTIATDCGGNRELVQDGKTGAIVPVGDTEATAKALIDLLQHPARASEWGRHARTAVVSSHRPEHIARQFSELYARVVDGL